jgi:hypothetical protein
MDEKDVEPINGHDHAAEHDGSNDAPESAGQQGQGQGVDATQRPGVMIPALRQFIVYYKPGCQNVHGEAREQVFCHGVKFAEAFIVFSVFRFDPVLGGYEAGFLTVNGADVRRIEEIIAADAPSSVN